MMYDECLKALNDRGVTLDDLVECAWFLHKQHHPNDDLQDVYDSVIAVMKKREVQNAILTGINYDIVTERGLLESKTLERIIMNDSGLYGLDEVLAYGICNIYGSIALTNFGYVDKVKPGIIDVLNHPHDGVCNTFLDDIVGAIAASAAGRLAHND